MINLHKDIVLELNPSGDFYSSVGNNLSKYKTFVSLDYNDDYLNVSFLCENDTFVSANTYTKDNDVLYKQEVFEIFIAQDDAAITDYLEIEINPNNAIFLGVINNPSGMGGSAKSLVMLDEELMHIKHFVTVHENSWSGTISIPFSLLSSQFKSSVNSYMINFFRVVLKDHPLTNDWSCSEDNSEFICFKSTTSSLKPNFHITNSFTQLVLK